MSTPEKEKQLSLLLVDDDSELCDMMQEFFAQMGHRLDYAYDGQSGLARALERKHDLIILDVMLPIVNGFTLLQQLRKRIAEPVILLTARDHRNDRILGLETGADDYVTKPFDPDELLARIRAVLRRSGRLDPSADFLRTFGDIQVNVRTREVWKGDQPIDLTALEFDILDLLTRSAGRIISRDEITATLLERDPTPYDRALDVHVSHLRRKLECGRALIRTVRGVGYIFAAES